MEPEQLESGHESGLPVAREDYSRPLWIGVATTLFVFFIEVIGGYVSGSLSLLSDAGHMIIDASSLLLSLLAIQAARALPTRERSYGLHRAGIFAAFLTASSWSGYRSGSCMRRISGSSLRRRLRVR